MTALADLDNAMNALADVNVALITLHPILRIANLPTPADAAAFVEDGIEAASRARRHLIALRTLLDEGGRSPCTCSHHYDQHDHAHGGYGCRVCSCYGYEAA